MSDLVLKISDGNKNIRVIYFNEFAFSLKHNAIASPFSFRFYFDPENNVHKLIARPGRYNRMTLEYKGEVLITGRILRQKYRAAATKELAEFTGYALPGVLEDCEIPTSSYPLQSNKLSLVQIASKLIEPFDLGIEVDSVVSSDANARLDTSQANPNYTIKSYLTELAQQKDIVLSHTADGKLLLTKSKANQAPIFDFDLTKGVPDGVEFDFDFDGQRLHSDITVQRQADIDGGNAGESSVQNAYVKNAYRPTVQTQTSGNNNDTAKAARRALANELRAITLKISLSDWSAKTGGLVIKPNNTITVIAPELYHYTKTKWFIESVDFKGNETETTAVLNCVRPEVYTYDVPSVDTVVF